MLNTEISDKLSSILLRNLKSGGSTESDGAVKVMAYLLMKEKESGLVDYKMTLEFANHLNEDLMYFMKESVTEQSWNQAVAEADKYTIEDYKTVILTKGKAMFGECEETPDSIVNLAKALLGSKEEETTADFCCGKGSFLLSSRRDNPKGKYVGVDIDYESALIARLRADILGEDVTIKVKDIFDLVRDDESYDKIFANYPFGLKIRHAMDSKLLDRILCGDIKNFRMYGKAEWLFNCVVADKLKENGKAVVLMTNVNLFSGPEKEFRQYFAEKGMIETIISLPERLYERMSIPVTMMVLSYGNKEIRMVDATKMYTSNRKMNILSETDISEIVNACRNASKYAKDISVSEIKKNDYSLYVNRYLVDEIKIDHGVKFESVIKSITRGTSITSKQLDDMSTDDDTNMKYLFLNNINDGMIDEDLKSLKYIDERNLRYCVHNNNLLISKISVPVKMAVAEIPEGETILASGNMYIVELDESKVNPYFVKAFFDSEQGQAILKKNMVVSTIHTISVESLTSLIIPLPSLEEQEKIALQYRAAQDEIKICRNRLNKAVSKLSEVYLESKGE